MRYNLDFEGKFKFLRAIDEKKMFLIDLLVQSAYAVAKWKIRRESFDSI